MACLLGLFFPVLWPSPDSTPTTHAATVSVVSFVLFGPVLAFFYTGSTNSSRQQFLPLGICNHSSLALDPGHPGCSVFCLTLFWITEAGIPGEVGPLRYRDGCPCTPGAALPLSD